MREWRDQVEGLGEGKTGGEAVRRIIGVPCQREGESPGEAGRTPMETSRA